MSTSRVQVVAGVLIENGRILLTQRSRSASGLLAFAWNCPGGKVEPGETDAEALVRELKEEIGCDVNVGPLLFDGVFEPPSVAIPCLVKHYAVKLRLPVQGPGHGQGPGQRPQLLTSDEGIGWFNPHELLALGCSLSLALKREDIAHWLKTW